MEDSLYLGELVAALFYLFAGARLMRLAAQTGEQPERLLGLLFLITGASYFVWWIPVAAAEAWETPLVFAGRVLYLPAPVILAVFTRRVFGRGTSTDIIEASAHAYLNAMHRALARKAGPKKKRKKKAKTKARTVKRRKSK